MYDLGFVYYNQNKYELALEMFDKTAILDPAWENNKFWACLMRYKLGYYDQTLQQIDELLDINNPNFESNLPSRNQIDAGIMYLNCWINKFNFGQNNYFITKTFGNFVHGDGNVSKLLFGYFRQEMERCLGTDVVNRYKVDTFANIIKKYLTN